MGDDVVETAFGKFLVTTGDLIDETTRAGTLWDGPGFLQPIAWEHGRLGDAGVTILDIGAHHGAFSIWLARQGAWRVIAVEAVPETMTRLKANLDLNQAWCADRVIPVPLAAYDHKTRLWIPPLDPGNSGGVALQLMQSSQAPTLVSAGPLDAFAWLYGSRVSLIKVDTQGCDGAALVGLQQTLRKDHPVIVFEWEEALVGRHGYDFVQIRSILTTLGYAIHAWPSQPGNYLAIWDGVGDAPG